MSQRRILITVTSVIEAQTVQSFLSSANIECKIDDGTTAGILPHLTLSMGGIRVSVWEDDFKLAQQLLNANPETDQNKNEPLTGHFDQTKIDLSERAQPSELITVKRWVPVFLAGLQDSWPFIHFTIFAKPIK